MPHPDRLLRTLALYRPRRSAWANAWPRHPSFDAAVRLAPYGAVFTVPGALAMYVVAHAPTASGWIGWVGAAWIAALAVWMLTAAAAYRWVARRSVCLWAVPDVTDVMRTVQSSDALRAQALQWLDASGDAALSARELALLRRAAQRMGLGSGASDFVYRSHRHDVELDGAFYHCFSQAPRFGPDEPYDRQNFAAAVAATDLAVGHMARARCRARAQELERSCAPAPVEERPRPRTRL